MNAKIINADIEFDPDIVGNNGRLFYISLHFKIEDGDVITGRFNFLQLPQILKKLEIDKFSQIVGQYVRVPDSQIGDKFIGFTHIFDNKMNLIKVEDRYFGDNFFDIYMNALELQKENEQLKEQIKIFEKFLEGNDLDIEWDLFCTAHVCDEEEVECKDCKYMRWTDD